MAPRIQIDSRPVSRRPGLHRRRFRGADATSWARGSRRPDTGARGIVPLGFGNLIRRAMVALSQGTRRAVVPQALGHERELGLMVAGHRMQVGWICVKQGLANSAPRL